MTYAEWALRHDADGKVSDLVDMLSQALPMTRDMMAVECQSGNAFEYTQGATGFGARLLLHWLGAL